MLNVVAIFDIGKTNKKFFLFDEQYHIVHEQIIQFDEVTDEDGFPCDDAIKLTQWIRATMTAALSMPGIKIESVNFSAYGASFCHIDDHGDLVTPLYNYLKPYPVSLQESLYERYGGDLSLSVETASPLLGSLNSGLQVYRLQQEEKTVFDSIRYSLHLPQYVSYVISGRAQAEITSIGCHTLLWDFIANDYHRWVKDTGIVDKFPSIHPSSKTIDVFFGNRHLLVGPGLHDSSAALIPYLAVFKEPFVLLSTGTWCITLNPFANTPLTKEQLEHDCLSYLDYTGNSVKASRLFAGNEHEQQVKRLAEHFGVPVSHYKTMAFDASLSGDMPSVLETTHRQTVSFTQKELSNYTDYSAAYHALIGDIIRQQKQATTRVLEGNTVQKMYVDGGFATNEIYMTLLAKAFPQMQVYAATVSQASAIGAAMVIHESWNRSAINERVIDIKLFG